MEILKNLMKVSREQLLKDFSLAVIREREIISEVVSFIAEIRKRKLYAEAGYSSLFSFLTEKYRYSEGAAYRRIQAAKVAQLFPEVLEYLSQGKLSLTSLSLLEPHITKENGKELIHKVFHQKKEEVEYLLSSLFLKEEPKTKDKIRRLPVIKKESEHFRSEGIKLGNLGLNESKEDVSVSQKEQEISLKISPVLSDTAKTEVQEIRRVKIEFTADEEVAKLIERAKELLRHKYPQGKLEDLVKEAFELLLEKKDPERKIKRHSEQNEVKRRISTGSLGLRPQDDKKSRYIPQALQREVFKGDEGRCSYVSPEGKTCGERNFLELDHVKPWGLGGSSTAENLRLLCRTHNQWRAEKTFRLNPQ